MYKLMLGILFYIVMTVTIEMIWGKYLTTSIIALIGLFMLLIVIIYLAKKQFKQLVLWLKQGADPNQKPHLTDVWRDIADYVVRLLKQKARENQQSTEQLNQLLDAIQVSPDGVLLLDKEHRIEWCNHAAADFFQLGAELDLKQHITNLIRFPEFVAYLDQNRYQTPLKLVQGHNRPVLRIEIHPYNQGRLLLLVNDITQIDNTERMRRNFVADVSHEIRTPLTVLSGFVETMQTLPLNEEKRNHYLYLMKQQSDRMLALVTDLLTLARLEDSPLPPTEQWVNVNIIFEQLQNMIKELSAGRHQITLSLMQDGWIAGVESEIVSAMANIVVNAIRYTDSGGEITIQFELRQEEGIFSVKDTGPGIPAEKIKNLTQRFYRLDKSRSRETGGTGLGLSIVKHIMLRHDGRLEIQSVEGKGSLFCLIFPSSRIRQA
ncbi:phosphate regulon sensor histidine kinase PhoR [Utexia brackfieldae]|uniref:phosphate regulon sensor histidine kinase PhoR n=1 Tax=Utexia brackfieldae TaxID=3074108 RepID=UPI00370D9DCA